jgi:Fe-S cluster assembly protein SufD
LNRDALFYLSSRGVPPAEAKALLTTAFVRDSLARIGEQAVREAFEADAEKWLATTPLPQGEREGPAAEGGGRVRA